MDSEEGAARALAGYRLNAADALKRMPATAGAPSAEVVAAGAAAVADILDSHTSNGNDGAEFDFAPSRYADLALRVFMAMEAATKTRHERMMKPCPANEKLEVTDAMLESALYDLRAANMSDLLADTKQFLAKLYRSMEYERLVALGEIPRLPDQCLDVPKT